MREPGKSIGDDEPGEARAEDDAAGADADERASSVFQRTPGSCVCQRCAQISSAGTRHAAEEAEQRQRDDEGDDARGERAAARKPREAYL